MVVSPRIAFAFVALVAPSAFAQAAAPAAASPPESATDPVGSTDAPSDPAASPAERAEAAVPSREAVRSREAGASPDTTPAANPSTTETEDVFANLEAQLSGEAPDASSKTSEEAAAPPAANRSAMNPDLSFVADFAAAWFSDDDHLQSGEHDPAATGFNLQALELNARSYVDPYLRFDATLVFRDSGVEIEEAYATTLSLPGGLQARFGQFLSRFGRINATHPHAWDFVDQPFIFGRVFGGENNRGVGVEGSVLLPLPWYAEVVASATGAAGDESARSFYGDDDRGVDSPADLLYVTALKQFYALSDDWSLLWGLSGAFGPNASGDANRTAVYGTDLFVKYRPITWASYASVSWQTEVLHRRRELPNAVLWDVGGYSQLAARFARRWSTAARYEYGSRTFDLDGRSISDPLDLDWTDTRHRVSASLTHAPSEFSRFRLQGSRDMPGWRDPIWAVFLAAEVVIGAHGAHPF